MISLSNIRQYSNVDFSDYLKMDGKSHSALKGIDQYGLPKMFVETDKVRIGKLVDGILTDPASVDMRSPLYPAAKAIAAGIMKSPMGSLIPHFKMQLSYTADMEYEGFVLPGKFRLDWLLPGHAVIDLKITHEKDVDTLINYMGYDNQLWGYAKVAGVPDRYIMAQRCKKLSDGRVIPIGEPILKKLPPLEPVNLFWANAITNHGIAA